MARFYLPPEAWRPEAVLIGDEARHLTQVLRLRPGATVELFDGAGRHCGAEVIAVARERVELKLGDAAQSRPPEPWIELAQAVPKGKNMELIVQKSVELGVAAIQPLVTRHSVVQPGEHKPEKWRRTALEACKQCGFNFIPTIAEPSPLDQWLVAPIPDTTFKIIASLAPGARPLREVCSDHASPRKVVVLIGPEGDFSADETAAAIAVGFQPVSLGERVLRVETAALFCVAALQFQYH